MAIKSLKSIFRTGKPVTTTVEAMLSAVEGDAWLEDCQGRIIFGEEGEAEGAFNIELGSDLLGVFHGPKVAADIVNLIVAKEGEKKSLGNEILSLYREINLIYNFSENLSKASSTDAVGALALEEAKSILKPRCGALFVMNPDERVIASFGNADWEVASASARRVLASENGGHQTATILNDHGLQVSAAGKEVDCSFLYAPLKIKDALRGFILLVDDPDRVFTAGDLKLLNTIGLMSASAIETSLLYERNLHEAEQRQEQLQLMNTAMTKFVPHQFIQALGHSEIMDVKLGDKVEREVTVFFSDIRGYTSISERMTLAENFDFISNYHQAVGPLIRKYDGFITQYLGDGLMAVFPESCDHAVLSAIEMQKVILGQEGQSMSMRVGMGMHTGPLIMGVIGDPDRMDAATIADTVNSASRMEGLCKYYGSRIIISHHTFSGLSIKDDIAWRSLGVVRVKGKELATEVYDIFEADDPSTKLLKESTRNRFASGLESYKKGLFEEATAHFAQVLSVHPEDRAAHFYLNRSIQYQTSKAIPDQWDGVEVLDFK